MEVHFLLSLQSHDAEPLGFNMSSAQNQPATSEKQLQLLPQDTKTHLQQFRQHPKIQVTHLEALTQLHSLHLPYLVLSVYAL